jgi:hypothetical protein
MRYQVYVNVIDRVGRSGKDIYIIHETPDGTFVVQDDCLVRLSQGEQPKPTLSLDYETLELLVNELARQGLKPQQGFVDGKLEATNNHLQDMRKLLKLS